MEFILKLHPVFVHFPVALLFCAALMDWWIAWRKKGSCTCVTTFMMLGLMGALASIVTGLLNREWQLSTGLLDDPKLIQIAAQHLWMSVTMAILFTVVLTLKLRWNHPDQRKWQYGLEALGVVALVITSHWGGVLVHGSL